MTSKIETETDVLSMRVHWVVFDTPGDPKIEKLSDLVSSFEDSAICSSFEDEGQWTVKITAPVNEEVELISQIQGLLEH